MKHITLAMAVLSFCTVAGFAQTKSTSHMTYPAKTTTTKDVAVVSDTNKKGTVEYGVVETTQTNEQGVMTGSEVAYVDYMPSKAALANEKKGEASIGVGGSYSFNKDTFDSRYTDIGLAGTAQVLWNMGANWAWGVDYMLLTPHNKSNHRPDAADSNFKYEKLRLQQIGLGGKLTLNGWDTWRVYIPLGVGAANVRMASKGERGGDYYTESKNDWGVGLYAGLGLQMDINESWFWGMEYRYSYAFVKDTKLTDFGRDKNFQFHSAFLRVGSRF